MFCCLEIIITNYDKLVSNCTFFSFSGSQRVNLQPNLSPLRRLSFAAIVLLKRKKRPQSNTQKRNHVEEFFGEDRPARSWLRYCEKPAFNKRYQFPISNNKTLPWELNLQPNVPVNLLIRIKNKIKKGLLVFHIIMFE